LGKELIMRGIWIQLRLAALVVGLLGMATQAGADDIGTGGEPPENTPADPPIVGVIVDVETIGYTTNSVVPHYQSLDDAAMSTVRGDLEAAGHTLVPVNSLNPGDLDGLDRLVIGVVAPPYTLSEAQMDVVESFVLDGHDLVFLGENNNYFRDNNVVVGGRFGITYPPVGGDPLETVLDLVATHPIMQGPFGDVTVVDGSNNNPTYYGSMLDPGPSGISILDFPGGNSACVVIEPCMLGLTSGCVVAVAEVNVWDNGQVNAGENRIFWNNIFAYSPECPATPVEKASWGEIKSTFR
jgi:hypothetical protein